MLRRRSSNLAAHSLPLNGSVILRDPPPRLRILWLSHFVPYPPTGGALQRTHHLLREVTRRHDVSLVALNQRSILPTQQAVDDAIQVLSEWCVDVRVFPMPWDASSWHRTAVRAGSFFTPTPFETNWMSSPTLARWLALHDGRDVFDLIHVDSIGLTPFLQYCPRAPVVLTHHNVESQLVRRRAKLEPRMLHRLYLRREAAKLEVWERHVCPAVGINVTVSELDRGRLQDVAGDVRTVVVENGVDVEYFRPGVSGCVENGGLLFAGSLGWFANRRAVGFFLEEIWPALQADGADRTMTFAGRDPPPELSSSHDPRVIVTGAVPDIRPYFDAASIYVCPIRDGGGTRLKVLDALAMGKPMVATALAVEGLDLVDGIHFLQAERPEQFVHQIRRLESDPELRQRLGRAGRSLVEERYSWNVIGEKLHRAYQLAVAGDVEPA